MLRAAKFAFIREYSGRIQTVMPSINKFKLTRLCDPSKFHMLLSGPFQRLDKRHMRAYQTLLNARGLSRLSAFQLKNCASSAALCMRAPWIRRTRARTACRRAHRDLPQ